VPALLYAWDDVVSRYIRKVVVHDTEIDGLLFLKPLPKGGELQEIARLVAPDCQELPKSLCNKRMVINHRNDLFPRTHFTTPSASPSRSVTIIHSIAIASGIPHLKVDILSLYTAFP